MYPDPKVTHAYRGFLRCGHMNWMAVDLREPEDSKSLAEDVAEIIRNGGWVDRVPIEEARGSVFGCPDDCPLSIKNNLSYRSKRDDNR